MFSSGAVCTGTGACAGDAVTGATISTTGEGDGDGEGKGDGVGDGNGNGAAGMSAGDGDGEGSRMSITAMVGEASGGAVSQEDASTIATSMMEPIGIKKLLLVLETARCAAEDGGPVSASKFLEIFNESTAGDMID